MAGQVHVVFGHKGKMREYSAPIDMDDDEEKEMDGGNCKPLHKGIKKTMKALRENIKSDMKLESLRM